MSDRNFILVLHSHIPYVLSHGTWPHGTDWLYEAAAESYQPLLDVFERLVSQGISPQVSVSFTPVLAEQLKSRVFAAGFRDHLKMKSEAAEEDRRYFRAGGERGLEALAVHWREAALRLLSEFDGRWSGDLISGFRRFQDEGHIEILTSAATHAYFPLLSRDESILAQVRQAKLSYRRHFGREARGFWVPECAYRPSGPWRPPQGGGSSRRRPGVDSLLDSQDIGFIFVDSHMLRGGKTRGVYADLFPLRGKGAGPGGRSFRPGRRSRPHDPTRAYRASPSGLPFFVRDEATGRQVWSREMGYPGDGWYLEFHKKRFPGGLRYWRITSARADLAQKAAYDREKADERLRENAAHFVGLLDKTLGTRRRGAVVSMYDTELFGHWWSEGPEWIYHVLKGLKGGPVKSSTAGSFLERRPPPAAMVALPEGSWGEGGGHSVWFNEATSWIWDRIYEMEKVAATLAPQSSPGGARLLKQFWREKFLLESSDWPFLISTWSARDYAENRAADHAVRAGRLASWLKRGRPLSPEESRLLARWEKEDGLFAEIAGPEGEVQR